MTELKASSPSRRQLVSSGSPLEPQIGFSRAVRVGNLIAVAGTAPIAIDGSTSGAGNAAAQARRCLEIIQGALKAAGATLANVIRTRIMLVNMDDWKAVSRVHAEAFADVRPACTFVQVVGFIDRAWLVEIEADAVVDGPTESRT